MNIGFKWTAVGLCLAAVTVCRGGEIQGHESAVIDNSKSPYAALRCIPMQDTHLTDGFWAKRFELAASGMLPALERTMLGEGSANLNRIRQVAGLIGGPQHGSDWG
jgi:hypothetical protein